METINITGGGQLNIDAGTKWNQLEEAYKNVFGSYLSVTSALRTRAEQTVLYTNWINKVPGASLAAAPGYSTHESGNAVDVGNPAIYPGDQRSWLLANCGNFGFSWTGRYFSSPELWHFDYVGSISAVAAVSNQDVVNRQNYLNGAFNAGLTVDGIVGPATTQAIINYQNVLGITADGIWGPNTQAAHQAYYDAHHAAPVNTGVLSYSDIQTGLNKFGYGLAVDGVWGPMSHNALGDFQSKHNLTVDYLVGPNTRAALGI